MSAAFDNVLTLDLECYLKKKLTSVRFIEAIYHNNVVRLSQIMPNLAQLSQGCTWSSRFSTFIPEMTSKRHGGLGPNC